MPFNRSLFSSERLNWGTPQAFFTELDKEFHFAIDVCASPENAKLEHYFNGDDGLYYDWPSPAFMNPPYGRVIGAWIEKAYHEHMKGVVVICLIPSRTDTRWWHDYIMKATEIRFIRGRLHFDERGPAPFPSALAIFR